MNNNILISLLYLCCCAGLLDTGNDVLNEEKTVNDELKEKNEIV